MSTEKVKFILILSSHAIRLNGGCTYGVRTRALMESKKAVPGVMKKQESNDDRCCNADGFDRL